MTTTGTHAPQTDSIAPWFTRTLRWGQTNLTEVEPLRYDRAWWRDYWARTSVQGLIINAGGIVAYYPSSFELQHRAQGIEHRDLYGEIVEDARTAGLTVIARMDSNRADQRFFDAHPDWFCRDVDGEPIRAGDKYVSCVNSDYYDSYLPAVFREIVERSSPDGFADNSWAGLGRSTICYCANCALAFRSDASAELPRTHDWSDSVYRRWIEWNYARRVQIWQQNNRVTREAGGADCRWIGMIGGDMDYNAERFVDAHALAAETPILFLDHQRRNPREGFAQNAEVGLRIASLLGPGKAAAESMPMYELGGPVFRLAAMPTAEVRLWVTQAIEGGILPWWHHIGSVHDDRRQYDTAHPLFAWHREHEADLVGRTPAATVAIAWSRINNDIGGADSMDARVAAPYRGMWQALVRARIPFLPVHLDDVRSLPSTVTTLILPNIAVMTDDQAEAVRDFNAHGGAVLASGETSRFDADGADRGDFALGAMLGIRDTGQRRGGIESASADIETFSRHTYLRTDTPIAALGDTDLIGFGGLLTVVEVIDGDRVPLRFVPAFPIYPPETSWMRETDSELPGLVLRDATDQHGPTAYFAADLDRCWTRDELPDHAVVIGEVVRWAAQQLPVEVSGRGDLNVQLWNAGNRTVVHLGNITTTTRAAGRQVDLIPSGELTVRVRVDSRGLHRVRHLVTGAQSDIVPVDGFIEVAVDPVVDHEVLVVEVTT